MQVDFTHVKAAEAQLFAKFDGLLVTVSDQAVQIRDLAAQVAEGMDVTEIQAALEAIAVELEVQAAKVAEPVPEPEPEPEPAPPVV